MTAIYRQQVETGTTFEAPCNITFGWQESRKGFSVWFKAGDPVTYTYIVVGTGHELPKAMWHELLATVVLPDGFHAFHLVRVRKGGAS